MFQKAITKYGLAVHLAVLTALPIALQPFLGVEALGTMVLWLTLLAALWIFSEPSIRPGEHLSLARARVCADVVRDPLCYFFLFALAFAAIRWCNSSIKLVYDPEQAVWSVTPPAATALPGSVEGAGFFPFALTLGTGVLVMGLRHALGKSARASYALATALIMGAGALATVALVCLERSPWLAQAMAGFAPSATPFTGFLFGFGLLMAIAASVQAESRGWARARFVTGLAVLGTASGLFFFAPPFVALAYLAVAAVLAIFSLVWLTHELKGSAAARVFVLWFIGLVLAVLLVRFFAPDEVRKQKAAQLDPTVAWSGAVNDANRTLSRISRTIWMEHPWIGAGLGSFRLNAPFAAEKEDWEFIPSEPATPLNGYWLLLAERGNVGCGVLALGLGLLLWAWGMRCFDAVTCVRRSPELSKFVFACPPMVWIPIPLILIVAVTGVFAPVFAVEMLMPLVAAVLALASSSFPRLASPGHSER